MKRQHLKSFIVIGFLIIVTGAAMASLNREPQGGVTPSGHQPPTVFSTGNGPLKLSGHLVQEKIFSGGDGTVTLALTMYADDVLSSDEREEQHVDMVIVLDQSGSMEGHKIEYARQSILNLLSGLSPHDRFAILGYADNVWRYSDLKEVTETNRQQFHR